MKKLFALFLTLSLLLCGCSVEIVFEPAETAVSSAVTVTGDDTLTIHYLYVGQADSIQKLLALQEADMSSKGTGKPEEMLQFSEIRALLAEIEAENACLSLKDLAVNGNDLIKLGITGRKIGETLHFLLEQVMDEQLPNDRQTLLDQIKPLN